MHTYVFYILTLRAGMYCAECKIIVSFCELLTTYRSDDTRDCIIQLLLRNRTTVSYASNTPCLWCRVLILLWQIFFSCCPPFVRFASADVRCLSYWSYFHFCVKFVTYVQFLKGISHPVSCKFGYDIVSCIVKAQVKHYLRQLVMVTATGKGTCWTRAATKGGSSGPTNRYLGCCVPFPFVGLLRFQHSQCLGQYNASNNRYFVSSVKLLRFLVSGFGGLGVACCL